MPDLIDAIATRTFTLNGAEHQKGSTVGLTRQHFDDLEPTGLVALAPSDEPAPAASAPPRKPRPRG